MKIMKLSELIEKSINDGSLENKLPDLHKLIGVPQPEKWHPEGDAFVHTMMVLKQAEQRFPNDTILHVAAICHDLGKALTRKSKWPSHYGHAELGIEPTKRTISDLVSLRWIGPQFNLEGANDINDGICLLTKYHMHIHLVGQMKYTTVANIWNEFQRLPNSTFGSTLLWMEKLADLGVCDHFGRGNVSDQPYLNGIRFLNYFNQYDQSCEYYSSPLMIQANDKQFINKTLIK